MFKSMHAIFLALTLLATAAPSPAQKWTIGNWGYQVNEATRHHRQRGGFHRRELRLKRRLVELRGQRGEIALRIDAVKRDLEGARGIESRLLRREFAQKREIAAIEARIAETEFAIDESRRRMRHLRARRDHGLVRQVADRIRGSHGRRSRGRGHRALRAERARLDGLLQEKAGLDASLVIVCDRLLVTENGLAKFAARIAQLDAECAALVRDCGEIDREIEAVERALRPARRGHRSRGLRRPFGSF